MNAVDVMKLALAGKTPAEIRELAELDAELRKAEKEEKAAEAEQTKIYELGTGSDEKKEPETEEPKDPEEEKDDTDYKSLYEETLKNLAEAQKQNRQADISGEQPEKERQERINNIFRSFM